MGDFACFLFFIFIFLLLHPQVHRTMVGIEQTLNKPIYE
jgi:hypothetical protein